MSEKAFSITISATSDEAIAAFKAVTGATDEAKESTANWAEKLLGMNAAWELIEKGAGVISSVGGMFKDIASGAVDFLSAGGEFSEQMGAMSNVAAKFGQDGEQVLKTVQEITGNTTDMGASMGIASKAIAAGLSGADMETALTYAKRWSEATGQSFEEASTVMLRAMQTGSMGVLERMGLIADESTTTADALQQMADKLEYMKEPSFNFADAMGSIGNSFTEFSTRIADAIQDAPALGELFDGLAGSLFEFVKGFDYSVFTEWSEVIVETLQILWNEFGSAFDGIVDIVSSAFSGLGDVGVKQFVTGVVDGLYVILETAASTWNDIVNLFQTVNMGDWIGEFVVLVTEAFSAIVLVAGRAVEGVMTPIGQAIDEMFGLVQDLAATMPNISDYLGFDPKNLDSVRELGRSIADVGTSAMKMGDEIAVAGHEFATSFQGVNSAAEGWKVNVDAIGKSHESVLGEINKIDYSPVVADLGDVEKASTAAFGAGTQDQVKANKEALKERQEDELTALDQRQEAIMDALDDRQGAEADALKERHSDELESIKERRNAAMEALQDQKDAEQAALEDSLEIERSESDKRQKDDLKKIDAKYKQEEQKLKDFESWVRANVTDKDLQNYYKDDIARKREALKDQKAAELERLKDLQKAEDTALKKRQEEEKKALKKTYEERKKAAEKALEEEQKAAKQAQEEERRALKDRQEDEKKSLKQRQTEETDAFKRDQKLGKATTAEGRETGKEIGRGIKEGMAESETAVLPGEEKAMAGGNRDINFILEGADEFMNSFFQKFMNRAIEEAERKGLVVVTQ